jgi:chromosome segregation ATPase
MSKKKGGKKGKGKGGDDELEKAKDEARMMTLQVEILQAKLVEQKEKADNAKASEHEVKSKLFELEKQYREEEDSRFMIITNMTRQYKSLEQQLEAEKNELKKKVREQEETIAMKESEILTLQKEKKEELEKKDEEIRDLRQKIQDMSSEFARMLRETLDKMQDRIEMAQWDNDHDPQIMKQLKDVGQQ